MRALRLLLTLVTLLPAAGALGAVLEVPPSASALPTFVVVTASGHLRLRPSDLGLVHTSRGLAVDARRLEAAVTAIGRALDRPPLPASYRLVGNRVVIEPGRPGVTVDVPRMRALVLDAVRGHRTGLRVPTHVLPPPPLPLHAIVVDLESFRLDLYAGPRLVRRFEVGVGQLRYATPPGAYYIKAKERNPAWHNPYSSWSAGMPAYIPPGPSNPLGTRALLLDRGALVIHGTPQPWTVGHRSSHGCIRMRRPDIESLYDQVDVGTPVFILP